MSGSAALGFASGCERKNTTTQDVLTNYLSRLDLHCAGIAVSFGGKKNSEAVGSRSGLSAEEQETGALAPKPFLVSSPFRVASMSKSVTALTALALSDQGGIDLETPIRQYLPDEAPSWLKSSGISLANLLSHTSGISDPAIYWMAAPGSIFDLLEANIFSAERLGFFRYSNINLSIAATILESVTGMRFDLLASRFVLEPAGIQAGFNWSGVPDSKRAECATLYRRGPDNNWQIQVDEAASVMSNNVSYLAEDGFNLTDYVPGTNGTLFSPQGGLRASLTDLLEIAPIVGSRSEMAAPFWTSNALGTNGDTEAGLFAASGMGSLIHPADISPWPGQKLVGHYGEAYGMHGAFWHLPKLNASMAYMASGIPERPAPPEVHPTLNVYTAPLFQMARHMIEELISK